jgi:hypothetical protein
MDADTDPGADPGRDPGRDRTVDVRRTATGGPPVDLDPTAPLDRFRSDERAIEGLPIRLVIALVVGVASLSVMMNMLSGINGLAVTELDAQPTPEVITPGGTDVTVTVVGADGEPVEGATVIVKGGSARLDGVSTAKTGPDGNATVAVTPSLRENQDEGTLVLDVKPPAGGGYTDKRGNAKVLVVKPSSD